VRGVVGGCEAGAVEGGEADALAGHGGRLVRGKVAL
jgi:hypothetical protein